MILMAKKKLGRPKGPKKNAFQLRLPTDLNKALEAAAKQSTRTKTGEIEYALKRYLADLGHWPPPSNDKQE